MEAICFNAKYAGFCNPDTVEVHTRRKDFCLFSNLVPSDYGLTEKLYQRRKFCFVHKEHEEKWDAAWASLEEMGRQKESFVTALKALQPEKKNWTAKMTAYWFTGDQPITGILFKLLQGIIPKKAIMTSAQKRRLCAFLTITKCDLALEDVHFENKMTVEEKKEAMILAMLQKVQGRFKEALVSTGDALLVEKTLRGHGNDQNLWSRGLRGGSNLCGECLMEVRGLLRAPRCPQTPAWELSQHKAEKREFPEEDSTQADCKTKRMMLKDSDP